MNNTNQEVPPGFFSDLSDSYENMHVLADNDVDYSEDYVYPDIEGSEPQQEENTSENIPETEEGYQYNPTLPLTKELAQREKAYIDNSMS